MTDYTDLKARLRVRRMQDGEMPNHYVRRLEVDRMEALAAITALEADIARLQTAHVQMQRAHDDLAAENARLRGADALLGEVWAHDINAIRQHEPEWVMILNRVRNYFVERDDAEFDARAALTAPTSGC